MNDLMKIDTQITSSFKKTIAETITRLDPRTLLLFGGMACLTMVLCVGFVSFSGSEMCISKSGFSITRPNNST